MNTATERTQNKGLVTGLFPDPESAESAYRALRLRGYSDDEINIMAFISNAAVSISPKTPIELVDVEKRP